MFQDCFDWGGQQRERVLGCAERGKIQQFRSETKHHIIKVKLKVKIIIETNIKNNIVRIITSGTAVKTAIIVEETLREGVVAVEVINKQFTKSSIITKIKVINI